MENIQNMTNEQFKSYKEERSDHDLLRDLSAGNTAAFDVIVERYNRPIANYLTRMLSDREKAFDLTQETFLRVYLNCKRYQFISTFSSWIYKIATNLALNELRRRKKVQFLPLVFKASRDDGEESKVKDVEDTRNFTPQEKMESNEIQSVIANEIQTMPLKYRTPLVLRDVQELSYIEISQITDLPIGTVKSRINRARKMLRKKVEHLM